MQRLKASANKKAAAPRKTSKPKPIRWIPRIRVLLLLAVVCVFGRIVFNDFVDWDDGPLIYGNSNLNPPTLSGLARHWKPFDPSNVQMYEPLVFTTWWILAHGAQLQFADIIGASLNPEIFHAANLLVHWMSACVVLEILRRLGFKDWPAAAGALIFAIHPLQTEPVAWATAMKDLLSGLFVMLAIWRYLVAMELTDRRRWIHYGIATFFFICALLSKPSTVIAPLILWVLDWLIFHRPWRGIAARLAPWFAMSLGIMLLTTHLQLTKGITYIPLYRRPAIAGDALAFYLAKLAWPVGLTWDYARTPVAVVIDPAFHHPLYWTWIFPVALAILIWRLKRPQLWAAGLVFFAGLLPVLGFTTFVYQFYSTVADRYVYISMLGVAMAVAWILSNYANRAVVGAFAVIVLALSCVSFTQAGVWKDHETFSRHETDLGIGNTLHYIVAAQYQDRLSDIALRRADAAQKIGDWREARKWTRQGQEDSNGAIKIYLAATNLHPLDTVNSGFIPIAYDHIRTDLIGVAGFLGTMAEFEKSLGHADQANEYLRQALDNFQEGIRITEHEMASQDEIPEKLRTKPETLHAELGMMYGMVHRYPDEISELKKSLEYKSDPDVEAKLKEAEAAEEKLRAASRPATAPEK
jgi:hypothetical protein